MLWYSNSSSVMEIQNHLKKVGVSAKKLVKNIFCLLLFFSTYFSYGQENIVRIPERVIIVNDEIVTMEEFREYPASLFIKNVTVHNGVSDERRAELFEKFGDKIPPKEFILEFIFHTEKVNVNDHAKDFIVQMINGESIKLSDLKGQVILLNFWATWCAPCIREFYAFPSKIIEPFKNSAFVLLPISRGETMDKVKETMAQLKKNGIDFNVGIDPDQSIFNLYARSEIPKNFVIDKNGVIRYVSTGYSEENMKELSSVIQKLLDE